MGGKGRAELEQVLRLENVTNFEFGAVSYYVSGLDRAVQFYRDVLGFKFRSRDVVARFDIGAVLFELVPTHDGSKAQVKGNGRLCLKVAISGRRFRNSVPVGSAAEMRKQRETAFSLPFQDPGGNEICLWQYTR